MLAEFQLGAMSTSDQNDAESENSKKPTSIPQIGFPITASISNTPKFENLHSVSHSTEEVGDETDQNNDGLIKSPPSSSNSPTGSPITASISKSPESQIKPSVSRSIEEVKKRHRFEDESDLNDKESENSQLPSSNIPIGSLYKPSISNSPNLEIRGSVSLSTDEAKRRRLGEEIDQDDDGFTTPTDSDHRIPVPTQCPPAPRKASSRKSKSPPETASETLRGIFPVDVSDEEAESLFPPRVEEEFAVKNEEGSQGR